MIVRSAHRLVVLAVALAAVACSSSSPSRDEAPIDVPDRETDDAGATEPEGPVVEHVPPSDAGDDGSSSSTLCAASDLALCLPFEGDANDHSKNGLVPIVENVGFIGGRQGLAASLGPTSSIRLPPNALFDASSATIEAWVKRSAQATADGVVFDADARYSLTITAAAEVLCKTSGGAVSGGKIAAEQWTHVACVVGGGAVHAYVNGVERARAQGGIVASPVSAEAVGGNSPSGEPFIGAIDSVRVFRTARTPAEIAAAATP